MWVEGLIRPCGPGDRALSRQHVDRPEKDYSPSRGRVDVACGTVKAGLLRARSGTRLIRDQGQLAFLISCRNLVNF